MTSFTKNPLSRRVRIAPMSYTGWEETMTIIETMKARERILRERRGRFRESCFLHDTSREL
jgi:hypothetical protein